MTTIRELRVLPPLAVGRLGSAAEPMDNYTAETDPDQPLAPRRLRPAPTFRIDPRSGAITGDDTPAELRFTDGQGKVRPVAPFLEVWALTSDDVLRPLTVDLLEADNLTPDDVQWRVEVGNHKIQRRTYDDNDRIDADTEWFSDHTAHELIGQCANFLADKFLPLGHVRYVKPTPEFPGIRLRFTPAGGHVYGAAYTDRPTDPDPNVVDFLYDASKGTWRGHADRTGDPRLTIPAQIYAGDDGPDGAWVSRGYLDDECDGLVHVKLDVGGTELVAYGRIGAGPPAYAPDVVPIRTVADELDQAMFGPAATGEDTLEHARAVAEEVVRRATETVRLMNTEVMNGNTVDGRVDAASTMVRQDTADTGRLYEPIMAPSLVDTAAVLALHQNVLAALRSGTAPWFADVLRDHHEVGDLTAKGRRKMPALMRGADGRSLALTRRQVDLVRLAARQEIFRQATEGPGGPR
ncbi:hypothetical protein ADK67_37525 [Saccharothrix sp. NRRL B-16348]|uniref:hypothetical protein n=1 Tax=Saccharothrix sp. NRRL B-16348 TaxID=1415542 RepID=UPI0006AF288F|nr:hypothetical protein [Saccharothrix sp. NRRL B-16348]KOX17926.1 hypothetical protein ADK67_37525 [Saccharothrix sp. NRRL B-16348]